MILLHHYDRKNDEAQFRWSVWPTYAYETMPQREWSEFLGQVLCAYTLREEGPMLKGLKVHTQPLSMSKMAELGEFAAGLAGEDVSL